MFGYVIADREQLSPEDESLYKSYYCGLCRSLKRQFGNLGRLTLNYDMTFMVLLLSDLYDSATETHRGRCVVHPCKERMMAANECIDYGAEMNLLLAYYNSLDDWEDDRNHAARNAARKIRKYVVRIEEKYPGKAAVVRESLAELHRLEHTGKPDPDGTANAFGRVLGQVFFWRNDRWGEECRLLGEALGRFIYWMDAWDDLDKDQKKHRYNPFLKLSQSPDYEDRVREILKDALGECAVILERLPLDEHLSVLRNILYSGVWSKYMLRMKKKEKLNGSESV